jgi:uncharacterized protein (TIGR02246 family)
MKHSFFICACMLIVTMLSAQNNSSDEMVIKKIIQQQEDAWNKHDWETLASYFTEDGTLINFVGEVWKGRNAIVAHFKLLSACCLEPTSLKFEVKTIRFVMSNIAIVYTEETLFADKDYDVPFRHYKKGDIDYKWKADVFVKNDNEWRITSTQMTLINQMISPHSSSEKN